MLCLALPPLRGSAQSQAVFPRNTWQWGWKQALSHVAIVSRCLVYSWGLHKGMVFFTVSSTAPFPWFPALLSILSGVCLLPQATYIDFTSLSWMEDIHHLNVWITWTWGLLFFSRTCLTHSRPDSVNRHIHSCEIHHSRGAGLQHRVNIRVHNFFNRAPHIYHHSHSTLSVADRESAKTRIYVYSW